MLNLLQIITLLKRGGGSTPMPQPWDDVPNSFVVSVRASSVSVDVKHIQFEQSEKNEMIGVSAHSVTIDVLSAV